LTGAWPVGHRKDPGQSFFELAVDVVVRRRGATRGGALLRLGFDFGQNIAEDIRRSQLVLGRHRSFGREEAARHGLEVGFVERLRQDLVGVVIGCLNLLGEGRRQQHHRAGPAAATREALEQVGGTSVRAAGEEKLGRSCGGDLEGMVQSLHDVNFVTRRPQKGRNTTGVTGVLLEN